MRLFYNRKRHTKGSTMAVIDAHAHIYTPKIASRAVEAIGKFYNIEMFGDGTAEGLLAAKERCPITHFIVHSVATTPHSAPVINDSIASECAKHPEFIGFATMHQDFEDPATELQRARDLGLHGLKLHPDTQMVNMDDPRLMEVYAICEEMGLPVVIHTGDYRYDYSHPRRLVNILRTFPDLVVDAAHFGCWSRYEVGWDVLHEVAMNERVFLDESSSQYFLGQRRTVELTRMWGTDRIMFGSDFPMWDPAREYEQLVSAGFSEDELENILWHNAERFAGVKVG